MAVTNNTISIEALYHNVNDLNAKIIKNSEDIIKIASKLQMATPTQISNMLIDINNLQHETASLNIKVKQINNELNQLNGKFNQSIIKANEISNKITLLKKNIQQDSNKFFSWATGREILIGIILAGILSVLRSVYVQIFGHHLLKNRRIK